MPRRTVIPRHFEEDALRVDEAPPPPPHRFSLIGFVKTTLAVLAVAYVAAYLASRTRGFRSYLEGFLEDRLGMPVQIGGARATWQLDVVLREVESRGASQPGAAGFSAEEAVFRWSPVRFGKRRLGSARYTLEVVRGRLSFAPGESGGWEPAVFDKVRSWLEKWAGFSVPRVKEAVPAVAAKPEAEGEGGAKPPVRLKPDFWERMNLSITEGDVVWWGRDGALIASAEGVELQVTPVRLPKRRMVHYLLTAETAQPAPGRSVQNLTLELLRAGSNEIVLAYAGEWQKVLPGDSSSDISGPGKKNAAGSELEQIRKELSSE